jgi:FlaA1/EpsC-like NDP-sugar epimerase
MDRVLKLEKQLGSIDSMVICWPGSSRRQINDVVERFQSLKVTFKIIPHFEEIISDQVSVNSIRHVEIDDLLEIGSRSRSIWPASAGTSRARASW